jgi:hypothetical protein
MAAIRAPPPPPTSTIVRNCEKSYAAANESATWPETRSVRCSFVFLSLRDVVYSFDKLNNTTINSRFLHNATFDPVEKRWKAGEFRGLIADKGYFQEYFTRDESYRNYPPQIF